MITVLKLLQNFTRLRSRTLGDAELEAVWVLTAATFVTVGIQLLSLTFAVTIGRVLNSKDPIRAVRHKRSDKPRSKRNVSSNGTVKSDDQGQSWFASVIRRVRRHEDPLALAST